MIKIRKSAERGHFNYGWLDTFHTFSFADYQDPRHERFRTLRVINEDRVQPGQGFGMHSHRDMEIITYILEGALQHKDSMGNTSIIKPGEAQRMTAGTGVTHSEFNPSQKEMVHLLQIWIFPERQGLTPGYEQKSFAAGIKKNDLSLIASRQGGAQAVKVHQDVQVYHGNLEEKRKLSYQPGAGRGVWIQLTKGALSVNGQKLNAGDGAAIEGGPDFEIAAASPAEFLLFDLK